MVLQSRNCLGLRRLFMLRFFICLLLVLARSLRYVRFGPGLRTITYLVVGIASGLSLGFLAALFETRQGPQYNFERAEVSGLGFILWPTAPAIT
jgi:hypothetical protein